MFLLSNLHYFFGDKIKYFCLSLYFLSTSTVEIRTTYLSKENETTPGEFLLQAFDRTAEISEDNPDYLDIKVAFQVKDPNSNTEIITNQAQITDDTDENGNPVVDIDSTPGEWNEGEDDQDIENVKV